MAKTAMKRNAISGILLGWYQRRHLAYILRSYFIIFFVFFLLFLLQVLFMHPASFNVEMQSTIEFKDFIL